MTAEQAVQQLLRHSGLPIAELSRRAEISRASVSEYVHGHRQPTVRQLERLAEAAGLQADITFTPSWADRQADLEAVLALADALPLRPQATRTRTWAELTAR